MIWTNEKAPLCLSVEVRPQVSEGPGEADVPEVVRHRGLQEDVEGHERPHVAGTGVKSLETVLTWQPLQVAEHNPGHLVLLTYISYHGTML